MVVVIAVLLSAVAGVTSAWVSHESGAMRTTPLNHEETTANNSSVSIYHEETPIVLETAGDQSIRGNTTLDPGTKFEVQIHATNQFFMSQSVAVSSDGEFAAAFNFSDFEPGTEFGVIVGLPRNNSTDLDALATVDGILRTRSNTSANDIATTEATTTDSTASATTTVASETSEASTSKATETTTRTPSTDFEKAADARTESEGQPGFGVLLALVGLSGLGFFRRTD
ncbi:BGTF surface domain-containing protein [Haladaptatus sp. DYF46]|uniref:BGTF surface domain-containing protein n=1 Tax=Haladaptatus sp. DYF46 TaxID=2886041 RepID=UPI001E2C2D8D|nr:BGTF surface domain-containing protein [Haladaptatus sp. DYF46]